jgi:nanoRNase/pAp phosphatase (c-di-AMP/oligoRNAs hydrolase)
MDFGLLLSLITTSENICIRSHENADADAVGASLSLKLIAQGLGKKAVVTAPRSVSKLGKRLADAYGHPIATSDPCNAFDLVIFVDATPPAEGLGGSRTAIIDHHEGGTDTPADFVFTDPSFPSASEMVYEFAEYLIAEKAIGAISQEMATLLLAGIVADTADLKLAVKETLQRICRISSMSGVEIRDVFTFLRSPKEPSLRVACLKGASRLSLGETDGYLIATTRVSSFQADVASSLIRLGADVAFAGGKKEGELKVSGRARGDLVARGLTLARVMETVAGRIGGHGGGHAGAAALKGDGQVDEVVKMCVRETKRQIKAIPEPAADRSPQVPSPGNKLN